MRVTNEVVDDELDLSTIALGGEVTIFCVPAQSLVMSHDGPVCLVGDRLRNDLSKDIALMRYKDDLAGSDGLEKTFGRTSNLKDRENADLGFCGRGYSSSLGVGLFYSLLWANQGFFATLEWFNLTIGVWRSW